MSEKTAKLNRKEAEKPRWVIVIEAMPSGGINVNGFPTQWSIATAILNSAMGVINGHFIQKAREGKLDDSLCIIESPILLPDKKKIIVPGSMH